MAVGTALYGFLAIWISFRLTRKYASERCAFLAAISIWFASSLPVYMYFNPSWSHAHSAFMVALFLYYWDHTRASRTPFQWALLGLIAGLMMDVYYPNALLLLFPLLESLGLYSRNWVAKQPALFRRTFVNNLIFAATALIAFLPTFITKNIIYGSFLNFGYREGWYWNSPALLKVCFSAQHGLFSWTPVLFLSVVGLFFLRITDRALGLYSVLVFVAFLYVIGCYQDWNGLSSFGNRFFVSLTAIFILGLSAFIGHFARVLSERRITIFAPVAAAVLILWNLGLIFQWGTHLIPTRDPISWRETAYNQVAVVPVRVAGTLKRYLTRRKQLMGNIEDQDVRQLKLHHPDSSE